MMAGAGIDYAVFLISRYHDYLRLGMDSGQAVVSGVDIDRQSDRRVRGHCVDHLSRDDLHPFGRLQKRRPGAGHFHCGGAAGRSDIPPGPAGPRRTARLDHAAPRSHPPLLAALGNTHCAPTGDPSARQSYGADHSGRLRTLAHYNYDDSKTLPKSVESAVGYATLAQHFPLNATIPEYLVVQSPQDLRKPAALVDLKQMEQRVSQLPDIATIRGAPPPTDKIERPNFRGWRRSKRAIQRFRHAVDGRRIRAVAEADAFPNVAAMLYPLANTGQRIARRWRTRQSRPRKSTTRPCSSAPCVHSASPCPSTSQRSPTPSTPRR